MVLPESCKLYSEAPMAVARIHSPAGSIGQGKALASIRSSLWYGLSSTGD